MRRVATAYRAVFYLLISATLATASDMQRGAAVGSLFGNGAGFMRGIAGDSTVAAPVQSASLFPDRKGRSLFVISARPVHRAEPAVPLGKRSGSSASIDQVLQLIGHAEAGPKGYDAVQYNATIPPPRRPTSLNIAEIFHWIDETPGQQHAIGRYQFIPKTLRRLVRDLDVDERAVFSPRLQDHLAARLLEEAGLMQMEAGALGRHQFMNNLARIWAGLPTSSGKSHYHGYAGNRATMSWARFDTEMARIFPG